MHWPAVGHHNRALALLLAGYAAGTLSAPLHALMAGHLAISPQHRMYIANLEARHGVALEESRPIPLRDHDRMLQAILSSSETNIVLAVPPQDPILPPPLVHYLGCRFPDLSWRLLGTGVQVCALDDRNGTDVLLHRVRAGHALPPQQRCESEVALVLYGAFSDGPRRYTRGDVAVVDSDERPVADHGQDCIYFAVTDAPPHLTGPLRRWVERFFGSA